MKVILDLTEDQLKELNKELKRLGVDTSKPEKKKLIPVIDRIEDFEDALEEYINPISSIVQQLLDYTGGDSFTISLQAQAKLSIITEVLNEGWTPDWNDSNEYKYYPYFDMRNDTLVFGNFDSWGTLSVAGSRLCFRTRELAEYAGKQFTEIYKQAFLIPKN